MFAKLARFCYLVLYSIKIFMSPIPARTSASSVEVRKPIICKAVDELLTTCFAKMSSCMDSDVEIGEMHERQRDLLATLFYRLTYSIGMLFHASINLKSAIFFVTNVIVIIESDYAAKKETWQLIILQGSQ